MCYGNLSELFFFVSAVSVRDLEKIMLRNVFSGAGKQSAFLDSTHSDMDKICCCPQSVQSSDDLAETLAILAAAQNFVNISWVTIAFAACI